MINYDNETRYLRKQTITNIAGNNNHTKSMADFQKWWRSIQSRSGWHVSKGYTIAPQSGGGWQITFPSTGDVMKTSA